MQSAPNKPLQLTRAGPALLHVLGILKTSTDLQRFPPARATERQGVRPP